MGRFLMYATIAVLAVFVLSSFTLLKHGSEGLSQVRTLSAHDLTAKATLYKDATVTVDGVLIYDGQLQTYELTDADANYPTPLRGLSDDAFLPLVGKQVRINGTLVIEEGNGIHVDVDSIRLVNETTPSAKATGS